MALENDYRREFFDDLVSQGVTFAGTTDYAEFEKAMQDPVRSRKLYNKAIDKGWELDDYLTWLEDYGPAKASTQPIVESQSIPTQGNVRKPAYNEYPMATAANSAADDEAKVNLAVNTMAGWNAAANDGYATYQAESDNEPDVAASPMYGPGGKAGNRVWNTSAPAAKRAASADPVEAIQAGATESGANALTEEQINAMEMENVAKVKAAREKEYQDALAKYGGEEGIAAEEQRRLEAAGVVQPKAKTGNEIDDLVADYQGEIDQQEEDLKKYNPDYKMDVTLNPNSRNDSFQQAVASGNGTQFGIERKNSAVISELATKNFVQKIYDRTEAGKPGKYLTIHDFNDKNRYSKMYTRLTDDITEEDMQQYVKDAFGYDYSNMSGASRKMFRDVANGQMAAEVFSKAAAEGKNLTGTQSVLSTFKNSLMASTLDAAITNWFGNDEMQIGYQAAMEKFGKSQEMLRNNHWYGGALIGAAGGVGMITDLAMLSGFMRWGTGFMSTPLVYDASTYGRFVPGVTGTMSDIIRSAITRNPYVVGLINSAMPLAKNYIEFAKLGAMSYVLQSAADPVTRDEIKNMYKDLDGVNGWLSATGQVVGNGLVGTLDAAHEEGITGAQLAVIGNVVGVANNSLVNNRMLRSYNRTIAKNYSEAAARMNAARIGRNYQALGVATSVGVESGYFTWKNINENIDAANEQIDEYNRTHKDKKNYVTFVTYDNKAEDFLQSLGMIVGMKAAGGQLILPKFLGNVHKERAFIGNKLMKSFNMELTEDDFSYLNDVGFGEFHKFDHNLVASLCTPRFVDEDGNKSDTWYEHIVDNNLVPFETMRKLRLALEDKVVVAGHTVDDNGKVIPTMDVRDVVTDAKVEKLPNGRWALVGTDIHGMPVMNLSYDTEREANAHLDKMNGLIADNARRQAELLMGDRVDMVKKAVEKWAIDNDVDPEYAQWMFMEYVTHRENALEDNAAMADEVRTAVAKEVVENRAKYIDEVRKLMTKKSGVDFDVLFGKDLDRITDSDIETLNAYTQMLLDWKKDMTTDPRILEVEKTSDMESGVQKRGIYDGRNVYYIGDLNNDKVYVIDPDTGNRTKVNSSEVQHVSESPVKDVIDQNVSTYDPDKGPQEGNIVWTIDNATGEWYQGVVKSYDADNVEITSDGKITKVIDKSVVERDQIRHAEYDKQQQLNEEQQGQNQIGAEAGSQQWMEVDGVLKPIRSAEERGDMMHVEYEDGTFEDVTFDEYQSRMRDVAAEQQQQQQKLEAQKQQKIAEVNGLNTLDDINNWRSGQDGAIDADVESELIKREKLIRDNHRAQTLQRVENAGLDELLALEKENEQWKDSQVASAIDWKKTDELSKISDASYQKGAGAFTDDKVQAEYDKGLENIDDTIESIKRGIGDIDRWLDYSPSDKRRAELEGSKRALEEGLSKMNEARARFVAEEQNMAAIEMEEYKKASGESDIFDNEDINDLARLAQMNFEVANDKSGKYSKEVIAKAKGRLRAITERRNWLKQEQEKYANSAEGKIDSAIKDINKSASLKDLEDVLNNNTEDEVKNDAKFKNAFEAKKKQLLISETPSEFADRMKEGLSDADKKKVDNILSIRNYNEIKNKAKTDAVAKKVSDAIEEALNAIAKDPSNMTYDEVENLFKLKNKDKDAAALFDKVMAAIKGTGVKVSIVPYLKDALGDEDWAGQVRLSADNQIWNNNKGYDHASQTLLHELIHVVTSEAIEYVEYNERGKDRYNLNGKQKSFNLTPEMIEGAREICKLWDILVRSKQAKGIFDKKPWNSKEWYDYGMKNPNEMVAEMANPAFRSKLKQMNLWHKMVDGVLKMFGVKKDNPDMTNNAYEQLFSSLEKILSNWTPQKGWSSDQGDVTGKLKITSDKPRETWQDRALASLKRFSEIKAEDIATASRNQREVARENWGDKRLKLVEKLADAMGLKLRFVYSVADGKANAQIENGEILIESTNDNPLKFLMGHEVMHHLRQNAPNVYESYLKTMRNIVGEGAFKRALDEQRKLYKEHKIAKSEDKLIEEVVADQSGALMENADLFESFVREMAEAGKPALLRRVNDVLEKINDFLAGVSDDFAGVNAHDLMRVAQIKAERDQLKKIYEQGLREAQKNWKARNVVRRNSLSDDMKRDLPPSFSEDYTRKEQTIVERGDIDDTQYSLKNPLKDNPWTAGKKQRGEGWKQINEMHNFIDSFWNWGKYADADDVKESVKKLTQFVKGNLTKELGTRIGSARIKTLLTNINKATQKQDLNGPVRTIQKMLNEAEIELELKDMLKLFDIQLQRKDNRGVVVPKWVDDNTRKVYDAVRATYGKMMQTSKDAEIAAKSKDIAEVHKDLLDKLRNYGIDPNTWNGADYKGNNWDVLSDADKDELRNLRNSYGALENERQILKQEREQLLLGQNLTETERELAQLRADLEQREMDNAIDPNVEWTEADKDMLYVVMPMRERLLNMRERYADLKQLEENWKNELAVLDNISRGPGYMARRAQQRDVVWAAEDAYIQKQKEIAAATREINDAMKNILTQGAERLKDWKEQEALHKGHMIRMTLDDFGRKRPLMKGEKSTKRSIKNIITAVQDFIDMPLQSLQFILSNDQNHLGGEGNLYRYFFKDPNTSIVTAWDNKRIATEENGAVLDDMVEKIWKGKVASMTGKDKAVDLLWNGRRPIKNLQALYGDMQSELGVEIERFMSQDEVDSNNKYGYQGRTDWTTNDTFKEGMTKGHALYLWLTWRQADGKMKMAKMGYTDKSMDAIENALGKEYIKFGEWLTEDFLPHLRDSKYNPRHVEIFGSSMNNTPHYFPLKIDKDQIRPKGGIEDIQSQFMPSLSTPNLISRMNNTAAIDPKADALEVLKGYLESMEQWHAMAPILRDFNAIHASKKVRKAMDASHNGSFNALMEAAQVATASQYEQRGLKAVDNLMKTFNRIVAAGARGHIAFRGMTAVKQLFSYDAFRAYSNDPKFQLDLSKNFCMPAAAMEWAMENMPSFRERASKGDIGLEGMNDYDDMNSFVKKYGENGMWMNKLFDQWAVAAGAKSVYDLMVKRKEAEFRRSNAANLTNYTNAEIKKLAHEWAINEAEICYNQSQQSSRNEFSSPLQKTGNSIVRPFMLFQNANIGYRRQSVTNLYNLYKLATREVTDREGNSLSSKEKARSAFASAFGFVMFGALLHQTWNLAGNTNHIYNYFADNLTDEEKEGYLRSTLLGIFTNGTTFGAPIASWANGYEWEPYEIYNEVKGMIDLYKSDKHDADELSRKIFYNLAMYTGGVNIETWENIFDGAKNLILDGGMMADKAIDFSILLNMNKTDRKGWAKALMQKYGPTEFAKGFKAAERSSSKADRTDELAKAWIQKMDNDFYEEMENIRSFEKKINGIREEAKKECQKNGADTDKILEEATKQIQDLMNGDDYARLKEFIASGNYDMYKMLMKSVRANIRYENSEGAPANENTQQISDKNIINEMNKLIAKSKELIK